MGSSHEVTRYLVLLALALAHGCSGPSGSPSAAATQPAESPRRETPGPSAPTETVPPPRPAADAPEPPSEPPEPRAEGNDAYLAIERGGLVRLTHEGRFESLSPSLVSVLEPRRDGGVYLAGTRGLGLRTRSGTRDLPVDPALGYIIALEALEGGKLWAVSREAVGSFDGAAWTVASKQTLGEGIEALVDVAVDGGGAVWVIASDRVWRSTGGPFAAVPFPVADPSLTALATSPAGVVHVRHARGMHRFERSAWSEVDLGVVEGTGGNGRRFSVQAAAFHADGTLFAAHADHLVLAHPSTSPVVRALRELAIPAMRILSLAVDREGRVWMSTDAGFAVLDRNGVPLGWWSFHATPELVGRIHEIAVTGIGPPLPPAPMVTGIVRGRVLRDATPIAGARVELCTFPTNPNQAGTPCGSADWAGRATSGDDGAFEITHVPVGRYRVVVQALNAPWRVTNIDKCCTQVRGDRPYELGMVQAR